MTNYRSIPTCPHTVINPVHVKVNGIIQYFCVRCGELIAWSTPDPEKERIVQGTPTELTEEERKELA
jgi:hypothetical protein